MGNVGTELRESFGWFLETFPGVAATTLLVNAGIILLVVALANVL